MAASRSSLYFLALCISVVAGYDQCRSAACYNAIIDQDLGPSVGYVPASHGNDCISFMGADKTVTLSGTTSVTSWEEQAYTDTATVLTYSAPSPTAAALRFRRQSNAQATETATPAASTPASSSLITSTTAAAASIPTYATSACPASSDYSAACSCAGYTASTSTVPYSTTEVVETTTWSQSYWPTSRTTTTMPACASASDYGLARGSIVVNNYKLDGLPAPVSAIPGALSASDCCAVCFASAESGCIWWTFDESKTNATCSMSLYSASGSNQCPQGAGHTEARRNANDTAPLVGFGPCVQQVDVFTQY